MREVELESIGEACAHAVADRGELGPFDDDGGVDVDGDVDAIGRRRQTSVQKNRGQQGLKSIREKGAFASSAALLFAASAGAASRDHWFASLSR